MIEYRSQDLFASTDLEAFAHGCNRQGAMGAGIAAQFRSRWPEMYAAYRAWCKNGIPHLGSVFPWSTDTPDSVGVIVYNCVTQDLGVPADLTAIRTALAYTALHAETRAIPRIGVPMIGCGIGKLKWPDVEEQIVSIDTPVRWIVHTLP